MEEDLVKYGVLALEGIAIGYAICYCLSSITNCVTCLLRVSRGQPCRPNFLKIKPHEIRLAVNPSVLQRLLGSSQNEIAYNYYLDDIEIPYNDLWQRKHKLLKPFFEEKDRDMSHYIGRLWVCLCAQLLQQKDKRRKEMSSRILLFRLIWGLTVATVLILIVGGVTTYRIGTNIQQLAFMGGLGAMAWAPILIMTERYERVDIHKVQQIVDELSPLFESAGYHLDCACKRPGWRRFCLPLFVYVRISLIMENRTSERDGNNDNDDDHSNGRADQVADVVDGLTKRSGVRKYSGSEDDFANSSHGTKEIDKTTTSSCDIEVGNIPSFISTSSEPETFKSCLGKESTDHRR